MLAVLRAGLSALGPSPRRPEPFDSSHGQGHGGTINLEEIRLEEHHGRPRSPPVFDPCALRTSEGRGYGYRLTTSPRLAGAA